MKRARLNTRLKSPRQPTRSTLPINRSSNTNRCLNNSRAQGWSQLPVTGLSPSIKQLNRVSFRKGLIMEELTDEHLSKAPAGLADNFQRDRIYSWLDLSLTHH